MIRAFFRGSTGRGNNGVVHAAARSFDLHIGGSRSLKAKRAVIRPILDVLRNRFRISAAEVGDHDRWQRAEIGVAVVAESEHRVRELLDAAERVVVSSPGVELLGVCSGWLELEDS